MSVFFRIFVANVLSLMEYRLAFLAQVGFMMLNNVFFLAVWYLFFERFGTIGGLDFWTYALLQAFLALVYGLHHTLFIGSWNVSSKIIEGGLDSEMLLPKNLLLRILMGRSDAAAMGDVVFWILVFAFLYSGASFASFLVFFSAAVASTSILVAITTFVQSLAFFVGDTDDLSGGVYDLVLGPSTYPPDIFRETSIRFVFYTVVPVFFITWLPFDLTRSFDPFWFAVLWAFAISVSAVAGATFHLGLKRYESWNLMTTRR